MNPIALLLVLSTLPTEASSSDTLFANPDRNQDHKVTTAESTRQNWPQPSSVVTLKNSSWWAGAACQVLVPTNGFITSTATEATPARSSRHPKRHLVCDRVVPDVGRGPIYGSAKPEMNQRRHRPHSDARRCSPIPDGRN